MNIFELQQSVQAIYPTATLLLSYSVVTDTAGNASIGLWNNAIGAQPTPDQLAAQLVLRQLHQAQASKQAEIYGAYTTARFGSVVPLPAESATLSFPTDQLTQTNIMGYLVAFNATDAPAQMPLQDVSGVMQLLTYAQLQSLAKGIAMQSMTAWQTLQSLLVQVAAAPTVDVVGLVVWPAAVVAA